MSSDGERLDASQETISKLTKLRQQAKYVDMRGTLYNGMRPESARLLAEDQLNRLIDRLCKGLASQPSKAFVLAEFEKTMGEFEPLDTEDRERLMRYLEEIMDILGIASSDGLLNRWMYGPLLSAPMDFCDGDGFQKESSSSAPQSALYVLKKT